MKTKIGKKSIGILIAAIIVASVVAAIAPTIGQEGDDGIVEPEWAPTGHWGPDLNITIKTPENGSCVHGEIDVTWVYNNSWGAQAGQPINLTGWLTVGILYWDTKDKQWCICETEEKSCSGGCSHFIIDLEDAKWDKHCGPKQCDDLYIYVWNTTGKYETPESSRFRNGTILRYDEVAPCIEAVDPIDGRWVNCTADLELNVSACESCKNCSLASVTADLSAVTRDIGASWPGTTSWPIGSFSDTGINAGRICLGESKTCLGTYWDFTIPQYALNTSCTASCSIVDIPVTAEDNSTDKDGQGNTQTDYLTFGVDCDDPDKVMGQDCEEVPGAIKITWTPGYDACSGVQYYKIYGIDLNASTPTQFYAGRTTGTETVFNFTGAHPNGEYCHYYQFNVSAVDNAFNEGEQSASTEPQHLKPGPPKNIILETLKDEYYACGQKQHWQLRANVSDEFGVPSPDVKVCVNESDLHLYPLMSKTLTPENKGDKVAEYEKEMSLTPPSSWWNVGHAYFCFWMPEVPGYYNVTACVCDERWPDLDLCDTLPIYFKPHEAQDAKLEADPTTIEEGETSTVTLTLLDNHGRPATWDKALVTLTITGKASFTTGGKTVTGWTDNGTLQATLVCEGAPDIVTVTADVGGHWFPSVEIVQMGPVTEFSIPMSQGRNDISIPLWAKDPTGNYDNSCENVFASLGTTVQSVYHYDAAEEEWSVWMPGGTPPGVEPLTEIIPGEGYQVYTSTSGTLTISGTFIKDQETLPATHKVVKGWNMIGFHSLNEHITPRTYIEGPTGRKTGIQYQEPLWSYHAGYRSTGAAVYDKEYMTPGWGYWVYITDDAGVIIPQWE
ncbi:MAG: hypothetical protein OCU12_04485 [Methanophagales archaeon]|nr:hypothetical protein [Methanophagales archaeon]